jgi:ankyrin repeat protein
MVICGETHRQWRDCWKSAKKGWYHCTLHGQSREELSSSMAIQDYQRPDGVTPLFMASQKGHTSVVNVLLRHGADPNLANHDGTTPLFMASQNGHTKLGRTSVVDVLLRHGTDPNLPLTAEPCSVPLTIAAGNGHLQTVERLADPNLPKTVEPYSVPLEIAATNGHAETVERLLEGGALINYQRPDGVTPLFMASQNGHTNVVDVLLRHGADPNLANHDGGTPLFMASQLGRTSKCCGCSTET